MKPALCLLALTSGVLALGQTNPPPAWQKNRQPKGGGLPSGMQPNQNQQPWQKRGTAPGNRMLGSTAPSHVFTRGDVEILTFEI